MEKSNNLFSVNKRGYLPMDFYSNDYNSGIPEKAKRPIAEFLSYLISVPESEEENFIKYLLSLKGCYPANIAIILFIGMRKMKSKEIVIVYHRLKNDKYTKKPINVLNAILNYYNMKLKDNRKFLGKTSITLIIPQNFNLRVAEELKNLPKNVKIEIISSDEWNNFLDWWAEVDEDTLKDDLCLGAYQLMWYNEEILNGGYDQFFDNKSDWDFEKTTSLFKDLLPKKEFENFEKAFKNFKNGKDNEDLDAEFEEELVQAALEKIAKKIMKMLKILGG